MDEVFHLSRDGIALKGNNGLYVTTFSVTEHAYHIPVISGLLAAVGTLMTLREMRQKPEIKSILNTIGGVLGMAEAGSRFIIARTLRIIGRPLPTSMAALEGVTVPFWPMAAKVIGRASTIIGVALSVMDIRDFLLAGDYDAAAWSGAGLIGMLLMIMIPGVGWTAAGAIITFVGFLGAALSADDKLEKWGKVGPFGQHPKLTPEEAEKELKEILRDINLAYAKSLEDRAGWFLSKAEYYRSGKAEERSNQLHDYQNQTGKSADGGVPLPIEEHKKLGPRADELQRTADALRLQAIFIKRAYK